MGNITIKRFNHLTNEIGAVYHEAALKFGLSDSMLLVLYTVCHNGEECLLSDITSETGTGKQTINSALRRLEADEIIYLTNTGGKKKSVCLTEKGKDFVKDTVLKLLEYENQLFSAWSEEERDIYIALTQRYLSEIKNKVKEL